MQGVTAQLVSAVLVLFIVSVITPIMTVRLLRKGRVLHWCRAVTNDKLLTGGAILGLASVLLAGAVEVLLGATPETIEGAALIGIVEELLKLITAFLTARFILNTYEYPPNWFGVGALSGAFFGIVEGVLFVLAVLQTPQLGVLAAVIMVFLRVGVLALHSLWTGVFVSAVKGDFPLFTRITLVLYPPLAHALYNHGVFSLMMGQTPVLSEIALPLGVSSLIALGLVVVAVGLILIVVKYVLENQLVLYPEAGGE